MVQVAAEVREKKPQWLLHGPSSLGVRSKVQPKEQRFAFSRMKVEYSARD